ncbi:MAG: EAL domain-containing protein [Lachnospiraceae bacterium]
MLLQTFNSGDSVDAVTYLKGNYEFRSQLELIVKQAKPWILLILGIDEFRGVNDLYSYTIGDKVLELFSKKILKNLSKDAFIYRLDGDGFGILFSTNDETIVLNFYEKIQRLAQTPMNIDGINISFTISGGISRYPLDGNESETLYRDARMALRTAKTRGKNQVILYSQEILRKEHFNMRLLGNLKESVQNEFRGFSMRYQPLIHAANGKLYGCEALLRWEHPDFTKEVTPYEFIPVLEASGLIIDVGKWVLESAVKQCKKWKDYFPEFQMNINVSSSQFEDPQFKFFVLDILKKYGVSPFSITLELTESEEISNPDEMRHVFDFIRGQGIKIAFDDFGTGYASLEIFRMLSVDELKIDRSFLNRLSYDMIDQKIIAQIVNLCHSMNMTVCVEGIETKETEVLVRQLGPEILQGYYYNRPMTADKFSDFYFSNREEKESVLCEKEKRKENEDQVYTPFRPIQPLSTEELVQHAHAGIIQLGLDREFTFISCNEGYRRILGYTAKEMRENFNNSAMEFVFPQDREYVNNEIARQLKYGDTITLEFRIVKADGEPLWILGTGSLVKSAQGLSLIVVIVENEQNFTEVPEIDEIEKCQLTRDSVTGLLNKGTTERKARNIISGAGSDNQYALYFIDLDDFRELKEKIGCKKADELICEIAKRLKDKWETSNVLGRVGADEFLLLKSFKESKEVEQLADELLRSLRTTYKDDNEERTISVSIGISCYPGDGYRFADLYRRALSALFCAKELGKDEYYRAAELVNENE